MSKFNGVKKLSPQSKSFIILFTVAVAGTYLSLILATSLQNNNTAKNLSFGADDYKIIAYPQGNNLVKTASAGEQDPIIDTIDWKTYTDTQFGLSFKYAPEWKVKPAARKDGYQIIEIDPGQKYYNMKIYISEKNFYAMDGLPIKEETIAGKTAQNVSNMLYGIKSGSYYYTFDVGLSVSLRPAFRAMVHTVSFTE